MARMTGNSISIGGVGGQYYFIDWQLAGQSVSGNYSTINWQAYFHYQTADAQLDNGSANLSGSRWANGGRVRNYGGTFTTRNVQLASGSFNIGHNNDGTRTLSVSGGVDVYQSGRSSGSQSWSLPTIPRNASITGHSGNINDESNPYISFSNPAGGRVDAWLELPGLTGTTTYGRRNSYSSGANFSLTTTERNAIRNAMANRKSTTVRYVIYTQNTGNWDFRDATISIVNANPVFTVVNYNDSNSTTSTITGDDQYIVQGQSVINLNIPTPATAQKGASMVKYTATINAVSTDINYSGSAINQTLGGNSNGASTNQTLSVTATDSRGNTTTVQKTVLVVPYSSPVVNVVAEREDSFGEDTEVDITGTFSTLIVAGVEKNSINATSGVSYRYRQVGGAYGSWVNITSTTSGANITTPTDPILTLDRDEAFEIQARITDVIGSVTTVIIVPIGRSAFRIGTDSNLYNNGNRVHATLDLYPVGTVIITSVNTNPQSNLGGTWVATTTASQSLFGMTMYGWRRSA